MNLIKTSIVVLLASLIATPAQAATVSRLFNIRMPVQTYRVMDNGAPVANARIEILGSNDFVKLAKITGESGTAHFYGTGYEKIRVVMPDGSVIKKNFINTH